MASWYMNVLGMVDKVDDIIYAPIKLATDWAGEPLRDWEHDRKMEELAKREQYEYL